MQKAEKQNLRDRVIKGIVLAGVSASLYAIVVNFAYVVVPREYCMSVGWSAGDALLCGISVIAAASAIWGIYLTIENAQEEFASASRLNVAPCISMIELTVKNRKFYFNEIKNRMLTEESNESEDSRSTNDNPLEISELLSEYAIFGKTIEYKTALTGEQQEKVTHADSMEARGGCYSFCPNPVAYMPLMFKNVGLGAAVNMRRGVQRVPVVDKSLYTHPRTLAVGESCFLGCYVDTSNPDVYGEYIIELSYFDVLGNEYRQCFDFAVGMEERDDGKQVPVISHSYIVESELIRKCVS